jgi:spermidine synthase
METRKRNSTEPLSPCSPRTRDTLPYYVLFFLSGFPALLYQIVWQRALFTIYGVNIESVTVIVTAFMVGLGLGSLAGGKLSTARSLPLLAVFGIIEMSIGIFGFFSLRMFHRVGAFTAGASTAKTGLVTAALLLFPTLLMGSTLPLLVAYFVRVTKNVGESVGLLYCANTFGSAVACYLAAVFVMRTLGESGSALLAATLNALVGGSALLLECITNRDYPLNSIAVEAYAAAVIRTVPLAAVLLLSTVLGFISLAYEIVWYRLYSFASGGRASCFALLLAFYLAGIAYGSFAVRDACRGKLRADPKGAASALVALMLWAGVASFLVGPALANAVRYVAYQVTFPFVFVGASLLGAAFPLLSHIAIRPIDQAGSKVSYIYLANIVGSASGSFVVGFVLMDHWPIQTICLFLLAAGALTAFLFSLYRGGRATRLAICGFAAAALAFFCSDRLFSNLYEKMLYKQAYSAARPFRHLKETRSGVIAVSEDGVVFGGGMYDGRFNTDLNHDTNGIFRAFALSSFHSHPSEVLMIGLSSGSWAQIIANHPDVQRLTIVEINPGYLELIPRYAQVAGLLHNPRVEIVIDDGRRWLLRNPNKTFDAVVMNTSFHWRAHMSNLLSVEFLRLVRSHLKPGGVFYYNTTGSPEVLLTGATVFPYSLRVWNFLAVSDRPIVVDKLRWEACLADYRIEGTRVFDLTDPTQRANLSEVVSLADTLGSEDPAREKAMEWGDTIRRRFSGKRLVTDDNMGTEWD